MDSLLRLDRARRDIALVARVDDAKAIRDKAEALRVYAKQAGYGLEIQNRAAEIKIRAERRAGEILQKEVNHSGGRPGKHLHDERVFKPKLADLGITEIQSHRWQMIAGVSEERFEAYVGGVKDSGGELTTRGILAAIKTDRWQPVLSSESFEWWTPKEYLEAAREVMGGIDLDPASCEEANKNVGAKKYYSREDDGLNELRPWAGRVFLNPPYGRQGPEFVERLLRELGREVKEAILLVNASATATRWFQPLFRGLLCFTNHRLDFDSPDGRGGACTFGSVFIYFGSNEKRFAEVFRRFGSIVKRWPANDAEAAIERGEDVGDSREMGEIHR